MPYLYFDYYYVILVVPVIIASLIVHARLRSTYSRFSEVHNMRGITGAQAAKIVLDYYGVTDVQIYHASGNLTDHYDPTKKLIRLSEGVYDSTSIAAVGIACHEAGHAAQHAESYLPIRVRNTILPVCNIGQSISLPLILFGFILGFEPLVWIGIGFFSFAVVFQLITLPVEFNASNIALSVIESNGLLNYEEKLGAGKVLKAAAMTYVAALAVSVANLLRLILRFTGRRR